MTDKDTYRYIVALGWGRDIDNAIAQLRREVKMYAAQGYIPQGGISITQLPSELGLTACTVVQAMTKTEHTP